MTPLALYIRKSVHPSILRDRLSATRIPQRIMLPSSPSLDAGTPAQPSVPAPVTGAGAYAAVGTKRPHQSDDVAATNTTPAAAPAPAPRVDARDTRRRDPDAPPAYFGAHYGEEFSFLTSDLPGIGGMIKSDPRTFIVEELGRPQDEVEDEKHQHIYARIARGGLNTRDVSQKLSKAFEVNEKQIGYAGLKDRNAWTVQTFSMQRKGENMKTSETFTKHFEATLASPTLQLKQVWCKKTYLHQGHLRGNKFRILLVNIGCDLDEALSRCVAIRDALIKRGGFANYFGIQRLGKGGQTANAGASYILKSRAVRLEDEKAAKEAKDGEVVKTYTLKQKKKRVFKDKSTRRMSPWLLRFRINAFQSLLFNQWLKRRIDRDLFRVLDGEDRLMKPDGESPKLEQPVETMKWWQKLRKNERDAAAQSAQSASSSGIVADGVESAVGASGADVSASTATQADTVTSTPVAEATDMTTESGPATGTAAGDAGVDAGAVAGVDVDVDADDVAVVAGDVAAAADDDDAKQGGPEEAQEEELSFTGPLFGHVLDVSAGAAGEVELELLREYDLDASDFDVFDVAGGRRPARIPLENFGVPFSVEAVPCMNTYCESLKDEGFGPVEAANADADAEASGGGDASASASASDAAAAAAAEMSSTSTGGILFTFALPKGCYATSLLREFTKNDQALEVEEDGKRGKQRTSTAGPRINKKHRV